METGDKKLQKVHICINSIKIVFEEVLNKFKHSGYQKYLRLNVFESIIAIK